MSAPLLFGRRERDIPVYRELSALTEPRTCLPGDVVRDALFPLTIERVAEIGEGSVFFESGDLCPLRWFSTAYEHADGAPIALVRP